MSEKSEKPDKGDKRAPSPIVLPKARLVRNRDLIDMATLYNEIVRRKQLHFLPADLAAPVIEEHLNQHVRWIVESKSATQAEQFAGAKVAAEQGVGGEMASRLQLIVDGAYPPGHLHRASFFPAGPGPHTASSQLLAFAAGMAEFGLPGVPADLAEAPVREIAVRLAAAEVERDERSRLRATALTSRGNLEPRTREMKQRIGNIIRGHYGLHSPELGAYGLKVRSRTLHRRARPAVVAIAAPPPSNSPRA